jgi:PX domain
VPDSHIVPSQVEEVKQAPANTLEVLQEISKNRRQAEKQYTQTRKCEDVATILNFKRVDISVQDGLVKEGGIFSASYPTYRVVTTSPGVSFDVRRKDADFAFLRKHLVRCFPHLLVPPCPKEQPKLLGDRIKRRERYYSRFMQAIARCEELKTSKFLLCFLQDPDVKAF